MLTRRTLLQRGLVAAPVLLRSPAALAAATGGPLALVTADTEAHVAVVALGGPLRVVQRVRTVADPRSIQAGPGGVAIVGHAGAGALSLLAGRPVRVRRVLRGFGSPRYTAFAPGGGLAYVSDSGHGELAVVDVGAGRVIRRVEVGAGARHLTLSPDGRTLWVALGSTAERLAVVDLRDPRRPHLTRHVTPPFGAHDVAFSPSGRRVWVTAGAERRIAVFAARGRRPLRVLGADAAPQHVTFGPTVAYVASGDGGAVRVHRLRDGAVHRRTRVPIGSYNIQRTGDHVLTPSLGTGALTVLDARGAVAGRVRAARNAHDACVV
jgi:DNA-binding beta-propeller fold protein YncE